MTESTLPTATLFESSTGLFITIDEIDSRLRRRRLVVQVADISIVAAVASLEADVDQRDRERAGGR